MGKGLPRATPFIVVLSFVKIVATSTSVGAFFGYLYAVKATITAVRVVFAVFYVAFYRIIFKHLLSPLRLLSAKGGKLYELN